MPTTRFFAGSDGTKTVFRASATKVYASASFGRYGLGFSGKPAGPGSFPVAEITRAQYVALNALKTRLSSGGHMAPSDSWVPNDALPSSGGEG
jgi:hypothetical protein